MTMPTLEYEEPAAMSPEPALRRLWWLALAWAALAILTTATTFLSWVVMPHGGLEMYLSMPYWWADTARPAAALMIIVACFLWRRGGLRRRCWPAAALAGLVVLLAFPPLLILWNSPALGFMGPSPWRVLLGQAGSCVTFAAVPIALLWAIAAPARFTPARLAGLAASFLALETAIDAQVILNLHESLNFRSSAFWDTIFSRGWFVGTVVVIVCEAAAAVLFACAAWRFRRGRSAWIAMLGSWLLVGLVILLSVTIYGIWWEAWEMSLPLHILRQVDNIGAMLLSFCIGLAFLIPLRNSDKLPAADQAGGTQRRRERGGERRGQFNVCPSVIAPGPHQRLTFLRGSAFLRFPRQ